MFSRTLARPEARTLPPLRQEALAMRRSATPPFSPFSPFPPFAPFAPFPSSTTLGVLRTPLVALALAFALTCAAPFPLGPTRAALAEGATLAASPTAACPATTEDENEAIARRWHEDAINNHDLAVLDEFLAPDIALDSATFSDNPGPKVVLGALLTGFPDVHHTVEAVIARGDFVAIRYTATGTQLGEFQGIAPTGSAATWTGINIFRIACGRIAEVWSEVDGIGRLQQLGVLPQP
jgi:predicted ester cyclase